MGVVAKQRTNDFCLEGRREGGKKGGRRETEERGCEGKENGGRREKREEGGEGERKQGVS